MKSLTVVCLVAGGFMCVAAQEPSKPVLRKGVSVQMPVASHAVEIRAADEQDATIIAITADGKMFVGAKPAELDELRHLSAAAVYVKADARARYQDVLSVMDALRGKRVGLLTATPGNVKKEGNILPPYGVMVAM
jgi:biopolymer transport protein ExbD